MWQAIVVPSCYATSTGLISNAATVGGVLFSVLVIRVFALMYGWLLSARRTRWQVRGIPIDWLVTCCRH